MELILSKIAEIVNGRIIGDASTLIRGTAGFESAGEEDITYAGSASYLKQIDSTRAGAVLVPKDFQSGNKNIIQVENPRIAFNSLSLMFAPKTVPVVGRDSEIHAGKNVTLGKNVSIGPFVTLGDDVFIGDGTVIHANVYIGNQVEILADAEIFPNVTILNGSKIGNRVIINAGSVIGSDGFGFEPTGEKNVKIHHTGIVQIDDDVEIGAVNTIDRGTTGRTWIQKGVKTDNLVHIGHNVVIGENTFLVAQVGISGSTTVGRHVILAGKVGVAGHLTIGDHVTVTAKGGVAQSIPSNEVVSGYPTMPHKKWLRMTRVLPDLPELKKRLSKLEQQVNQLMGSDTSDEN